MHVRLKFIGVCIFVQNLFGFFFNSPMSSFEIVACSIFRFYEKSNNKRTHKNDAFVHNTNIHIVCGFKLSSFIHIYVYLSVQDF